ncbi:hypothetical protein BU25DRAFT_257373 [Macroventuria anomochaeta]|uniref:Uncharacterized protein n=1 Tax=Macroventuria anomochaeta TaxID=301207 RepID=A0ACB6SAM1_9PLEO|nr:uncharacterized protein BU25DRAFT_257373 [Macroventuria anomochaeta]KAF2630398.1 hypothetical protein BU25DRAFT_257373 [Macroventuria anomochaeta]
MSREECRHQAFACMRTVASSCCCSHQDAVCMYTIALRHRYICSGALWHSVRHPAARGIWPWSCETSLNETAYSLVAFRGAVESDIDYGFRIVVASSAYVPRYRWVGFECAVLRVRAYLSPAVQQEEVPSHVRGRRRYLLSSFDSLARRSCTLSLTSAEVDWQKDGTGCCCAKSML